MSSRQKNIALIIGFAVMLFISYQFSFKKTLAVKARVSKLEKDKAQLDNAESRIASLKIEGQYLDSILQSNDLSIEHTFQQTLLLKITQFATAHQLKIIASNEPHSFTTTGTNLLSYQIEVQGSFRDLMLFSNYIEQQRLATVASLKFIKKKNYRTRRNYLTATLILQRFSQ
jgi:hypothetical protein